MGDSAPGDEILHPWSASIVVRVLERWGAYRHTNTEQEHKWNGVLKNILEHVNTFPSVAGRVLQSYAFSDLPLGRTDSSESLRNVHAELMRIFQEVSPHSSRSNGGVERVAPLGEVRGLKPFLLSSLSGTTPSISDFVEHSLGYSPSFVSHASDNGRIHFPTIEEIICSSSHRKGPPDYSASGSCASQKPDESLMSEEQRSKEVPEQSSRIAAHQSVKPSTTSSVQGVLSPMQALLIKATDDGGELPLSLGALSSMAHPEAVQAYEDMYRHALLLGCSSRQMDNQEKSSTGPERREEAARGRKPLCFPFFVTSLSRRSARAINDEAARTDRSLIRPDVDSAREMEAGPWLSHFSTSSDEDEDEEEDNHTMAPPLAWPTTQEDDAEASPPSELVMVNGRFEMRLLKEKRSGKRPRDPPTADESQPSRGRGRPRKVLNDVQAAQSSETDVQRSPEDYAEGGGSEKKLTTLVTNGLANEEENSKKTKEVNHAFRTAGRRRKANSVLKRKGCPAVSVVTVDGVERKTKEEIRELLLSWNLSPTLREAFLIAVEDVSEGEQETGGGGSIGERIPLNIFQSSGDTRPKANEAGESEGLNASPLSSCSTDTPTNSSVSGEKWRDDE